MEGRAGPTAVGRGGGCGGNCAHRDAGAAVWFSCGAGPATESAGGQRPTLEQITAFADAAAWPAVSRDGKMLAFIRGPGTWGSLGQVYVKMLPNGEPVAVTHDNARRLQPEFSPDGSRVSYTVVDRMGHGTPGQFRYSGARRDYGCRTPAD